MTHYLLTISYDGSNYFGWQIQNNRPTVAGEILNNLKTIFKMNQFKLVGGSRTDLGVHAFNQTAKLTTSIKIDPLKLQSLLNQRLRDIKIKKIEITSIDFHPLKSMNKEYHYFFTDNKFITPFNYNYITGWNLSGFNKRRFLLAAKTFLGTHDFSNFFIKGSDILTTKKTIYQISLLFRNSPYPCYLVKIVGNGFLRKMVRMIVGSLYLVAMGKLSMEELNKRIDVKVLKKDYIAPPQGLYLKRINY